MYVEEDDLARFVSREELSFDDVKIVMRGVRYDRGVDEGFAYANSLLPEAADYLRPHTLRALIRADMTDQQAALDLELNKSFFSRLAFLLPSLMQFFDKKERTRNARGLISIIDDCHNDFHAATASPRKDRQLREAKEKLAAASKLVSASASALEDAERYFGIEFDRYRKAFFLPDNGPSRFLGDLIHEMKMCSGVLEIVKATADIRPKRLFISGNDKRTTVVEWAYHMCSMWSGPKLVTTPGSDFAALCSLLFEAVSGRSDEGLAGAINRYARSEDRKQWDQEGDDQEEMEDDNFLAEKRTMLTSQREIDLCKILLKTSHLSDVARLLLIERMVHEQQAYEVAETRYGPRQVYLSQMNEEQREKMLSDAVSLMKPEQILKLDDQFASGKSLRGLDIELGQQRRSSSKGTIDV